MNVKRFDSEGREIKDKPSVEVNYERTWSHGGWPQAITLIVMTLAVVAVCGIAAWWTK